jgi:hypothetical protein
MATVETVIVLPLLLMLLYGIIEMSLVLSRWQAVSNAAREGARTAIVFRSTCDVATVEAAVRQRVRDYTQPLGIVYRASAAHRIRIRESPSPAPINFACSPRSRRA